MSTERKKKNKKFKSGRKNEKFLPLFGDLMQILKSHGDDNATRTNNEFAITFS